MAKPTLQLGGKARRLVYDMNALAELESELGLTMTEIGSRLETGRQGVRELRALVWCGLLHEVDGDPMRLSIREIGRDMTAAGFFTDSATQTRVGEVVYAALSEAFPELARREPSEGAEGNANAPSGTGAN